MEAGETYWAVIEPIWDRVSIYDGPDVYLRQIETVAEAQILLLAAHWCQSEICNGGLHRFFHNPTGVLAPEAVAGLRAIGLHGAAAAVGTAMEFFGGAYPREQEIRCEALDRLQGTARRQWDPFIALDAAFYADLDDSNDRFARAADAYAARVAAV